MSWGDTRGVLQYVPQFRGKLFVVVVSCPQSALAEVMLDFISLQNIGVRLVLASDAQTIEQLADLAADVELKCGQVVQPMDALMVSPVLQRGQTALVDIDGLDPLGADVAKFAVELNASKLILLNEGAGIELDGQPIHALRAAEATSWKEKPGLAGIALLEKSVAACHAGVPRVHVLDGSVPGVLLSELFSNEGVGTMVYADSYRSIRPIVEEDIVELLAMIGRSVRSTHLVPRTYEAIRACMEDYWVLDIDGNVVGCYALYGYQETNLAEIACLYVKQSHEGMGYGAELVKNGEEQARKRGMKGVFALTNRASVFFQKTMGYQEWSMEKLPASRQLMLQQSGRNSRAFGKEL